MFQPGTKEGEGKREQAECAPSLASPSRSWSPAPERRENPKAPAASHDDGAPAEAPCNRLGDDKHNVSGPLFTPSKRHAKERNAAFHAPSHMLHNGPLTHVVR
ncbi:hypothetical protein ZWY2020_032880 [Hordeum vulgare]|nr:hypothetical protein ZWY2020_032880 [Hordeum vulgare]